MSRSVWTSGVGGGGLQGYDSIQHVKEYIDALIGMDYSFTQCAPELPPITPPPPPPQPPDYKPPPPPPVETRTVKILPVGERKLPDANNGETVKITAIVTCKTDETVSKPKDTAYLIIDGAIADKKLTENGTVTFDWEATSVPINTHIICVAVDPSATCKSPGKDCKRITVSSLTLGIAEQLAKEKASSSEQRKMLEQARSQLRKDITEAELEVPGYSYTLPTPIAITEPVTPIEQAPVTSPTELISKYGNISIIGLPVNLPLIPETPTYVYVDNKDVGRLYELPKTITNIAVGTHSIYVRSGNITSQTKTAVVKENETTNIIL